MLNQRNPILQQLNNSSVKNVASNGNNMFGNLKQIKNMVNMIKSAGNPQAMLESMTNNNPQLKEVMNIVKNSGGNPQQAFYNLAKQKGVNPDEVLNAVSSLIR